MCKLSLKRFLSLIFLGTKTYASSQYTVSGTAVTPPSFHTAIPGARTFLLPCSRRWEGDEWQPLGQVAPVQAEMRGRSPDPAPQLTWLGGCSFLPQQAGSAHHMRNMLSPPITTKYMYILCMPLEDQRMGPSVPDQTPCTEPVVSCKHSSRKGGGRQ